MALSITQLCIGCQACLQVCPNQAVLLTDTGYCQIDASGCSECAGDFADAQCASICPVECAIVDAQGQALNPLGSLQGSFVLQAVPYDGLECV